MAPGLSRSTIAPIPFTTTASIGASLRKKRPARNFRRSSHGSDAAERLRPDLSDIGAPGTPNGDRWRAYGIGQAVTAPDGRESRVLIRDTWNTDIVPELAPQPGDPIVYKHRYSAFHETELDAVLKQLGATHLIVTGGTTSVCVESTIRDAYSRDYSCILLEDCTAEPIGRGARGYLGVPGQESSPGGSNYDATLVLIQTLFGWVSTTFTAVIGRNDGVARPASVEPV